MTWYQTLITALVSIAFTKLMDFLTAKAEERREFRKIRRKLAMEEIDILKNEIGQIYELASNWASYNQKQNHYIQFFNEEYRLLGKFHKYGNIAQKARDVLHWSKIIASDERDHASSVIEAKSQLHSSFKEFTNECEKYLNSI